MINKLRNTIELLQEINRGITEQLIAANEKYAKLIELLDSEVKENIFQSNCNEIDTAEKQIKEEVPELSSSDIDTKTDNDTETDDAIIEVVSPVFDYMQSEMKIISDSIDQLSHRVRDLCQDDEQIYLNVEDINTGFNTFLDSTKEIDEDCNKLHSSTEMQNILISQLSESGWVNIVLRMFAYSKIKTFKYQYLNDILQSLYSNIFMQYNNFGITIVIPKVLDDEYDNAIHEYNNSSCILIENYCDLSPSEYINKVYDIIQVGYKFKDLSINNKSQNPVIFYYS